MLQFDPYLDEPLAGLDLLQQMAVESTESGLPVPPVPRELVPAFQYLGDGTFGTAALRRPLIAIKDWAAEARWAAPYLFYGADGRGLTRQYLHYYLCCGPFVLLAQYSRDMLAEPPAAVGFAPVLDRVPDMLDRIEAAVAGRRLPPEDRLILVDSDLVGRRWAHARPSQPELSWRDEGADPITAVTLRYLLAL